MKKEDVFKKLRKIGMALTLAVMTTNSLGASADEISNTLASSIYNAIDEPKYEDYLLESLSNLPVSLLEFLNTYHSKVIILAGEKDADKKFEEVYNQKLSTSIKGFAMPYKCSVYVEGGEHKGYYQKYASSSQGFTEEEFNKLIVKSTMFHEIGHLLDSLLAYVSTSDDFAQIYNEEVNNFMNTREFLVDSFRIKANIQNPVEYFASAFSCFISYPDDLQEQCPKTYNYISVFVEQIEIENERINSLRNR